METTEGAMGAVIPFPIRRTQGETRGVRVRPDHPGEVVILPVVQFLRHEPVPLAPVKPAVREPL
jgi:hypothetical protein